MKEVANKSLDELDLIAALLSDAQTLHSEVFSPRAAKLTIRKVRKRVAREGLGFLTKTLPRLGKAFDYALSGEASLDATKLAFKSQPDSQLPMFMGELFRCIFSLDGRLLPTPCVKCIKTIRQILYLFYKYELPYDPEVEEEVVTAFEKAEVDLEALKAPLEKLLQCSDEGRLCDGACLPTQNEETRTGLREGMRCHDVPTVKTLANLPIGSRSRRKCLCNEKTVGTLVYRARLALQKAFSSFDVTDEFPFASPRNTPSKEWAWDHYDRIISSAFDPYDIWPRHGPGAVSTKEQLWEKYQWTRISSRISQHYPIDKYFFVNLDHVCDRQQELSALSSEDAFARVCLVPKDSRGPRLISCEPVDFQWVQQGLGRAIVDHVERSRITRYNVHFTNQQPNQCGALLGSITGKYATLDLKEASDRISCSLVRLLFPKHISDVLMSCRTTGTELPNGKILPLQKFAPMGSALCFPVLALTIWAILTAGAPDADTRESILVYGDDVIVPTAYAECAMRNLELFGLVINRNKSYVKGFFRESCGVDAYLGTNVTPVRLRTVWTHHPSPESYASWVAYANSMFIRRYYGTYDYIVRALTQLYGAVPETDKSFETCISLPAVPEGHRSTTRFYRPLQKGQRYIWDVRSRAIKKKIDGWSMLLRYFVEHGDQSSSSSANDTSQMRCDPLSQIFKIEDLQAASTSVGQYTKRRASMLVRCWR